MLAGMTQQETDQHNFAYCKSVSNRLKDAYDGLYYRCPECGEIIRIDSDEGEVECECGFTGFDEDFEQCCIDEIFDEIFDVEYYIGGRGEFRGVRLMIACGGPNVYVDTREREVQLYWYQDHARYYIPTDVCDAIDQCYEELYRCLTERCRV